MKKYLLLLAALLIAVPDGGAEAAAVKLGRGKAYSVNAGASLGGDTKLEEKKPEGWCDTDAQCASKEKCQGNACVSVCTQPPARPGMSLARICAGKKCIADPSTPHAFKCVDNCYNVTCKSGYTTEENASGCCCVAASCPSGQRLSGGSCVSNCTGVTCKSGSSPVSKPNSCCCEATAITCPSNCLSCSGSSMCTSCASGYELQGSNCVAAECPSGQLKIGGQCVQCIDGSSITCGSGSYSSYHRLSNGTCCLLPTGCTGFTNFDMSCTGCISGYTLTNGKCVKSASCSVTTPFHYNEAYMACTSCSPTYGCQGSKFSSPGYGGQDSACGTNSQCETGWCLPGGTPGRSGVRVQGSHCS